MSPNPTVAAQVLDEIPDGIELARTLVTVNDVVPLADPPFVEEGATVGVGAVVAVALASAVGDGVTVVVDVAVLAGTDVSRCCPVEDGR